MNSKTGRQITVTDRVRSITADIKDNISGALPPDISFEHFEAVFLYAVGQNMDLLTCDPGSLKTALLRCAADRLVPDGREAVILPFIESKKDRRTGQWHKRTVAQFLPMVAGIRKRAAELGGITSIVCENVHAADHFDFRLGDEPYIDHAPAGLGRDRGPIIGAYAVFKRGREIVHREVMAREEIERARRSSRAPDSPAWTNWFGEMSRKTVLKRGAKSVPMMSPELRAMIDREDEPGPTIEGTRSIENTPYVPPRVDANPLRAIDWQEPEDQASAEDAEAIEVEAAPEPTHKPTQQRSRAPKGGTPDKGRTRTHERQTAPVEGPPDDGVPPAGEAPEPVADADVEEPASPSAEPAQTAVAAEAPSFNDLLWLLADALMEVQHEDDVQRTITDWRKAHNIVASQLPSNLRGKVTAIKALFIDVFAGHAPADLHGAIEETIGTPRPD